MSPRTTGMRRALSGVTPRERDGEGDTPPATSWPCGALSQPSACPVPALSPPPGGSQHSRELAQLKGASLGEAGVSRQQVLLGLCPDSVLAQGGVQLSSLRAQSARTPGLFPASSRRAAWETRRDKAMVCPAPPPDLGKWPEAGPMARSPILSLELQSLGTRPPKPGTTPLQTRRQT